MQCRSRECACGLAPELVTADGWQQAPTAADCCSPPPQHARCREMHVCTQVLPAGPAAGAHLCCKEARPAQVVAPVGCAGGILQRVGGQQVLDHLGRLGQHTAGGRWVGGWEMSGEQLAALVHLDVQHALAGGVLCWCM
jgi:hypothetical protein